MPRCGGCDKNGGRRAREPDRLPKEEQEEDCEGARISRSGDYVGRKIIFKFFPEVLIDPPSLFPARSSSRFGAS